MDTDQHGLTRRTAVPSQKDAAIFQFRLGEIEQQADSQTARLEVVENLTDVGRDEAVYGFELYDDPVLDHDIRNVSPDNDPFVANCEWRLGLDGKSPG